jgi:hydroxyacyl-ACP dehydratase HTD2-like protein with hotdog domain
LKGLEKMKNHKNIENFSKTTRREIIQEIADITGMEETNFVNEQMKELNIGKILHLANDLYYEDVFEDEDIIYINVLVTMLRVIKD